ncbi:MAG: Fic family protein, partial [Bacteroidia bacterium]|nr:Fic family protein [Bacteroidia bacterium]
TVDGKPIKDVMEVKGHDKVISDILRIGKGELNLSEKRIKDIHLAIMHEDVPEQQNKIGKWKPENNYIYNYKGERFDFVDRNDVPEKIHELLNWLNSHGDKIKNKDKNAIHPVLLAFEFHLRYLTIHPFYDGNGRTARILSNLILISYGYPPIIIKTDEKEVYYRYMGDVQGYGGEQDLLFEFLCSLLIKSQELILEAIKGNDIDEPDDLDKKLKLLTKELEAVNPDDEVKEHFDATVFHRVFNGWFTDLLKESINTIQKFNKLFNSTQHKINIYNNRSIGFVTFIDESSEEIIEKLKIECEKNNVGDFRPDTFLSFSSFYGSLKKGGSDLINCNYGFEIKFEYAKFSITIDEFVETENKKKSVFFENRLWYEPVSKGEIKKIASKLGETIFQHIDFHTKKNGIR